MTIRVAKVPGSKWRRVYLEPYFGSGAMLFAKPRSPTEVVADVDGRVVALFRVLRDRPDELARAVRLTPAPPTLTAQEVKEAWPTTQHGRSGERSTDRADSARDKGRPRCVGR